MMLSKAIEKLAKVEKASKILDFFVKYGITQTELFRLHDFTEREQFGIISADRKGKDGYSRNENKKRRTALAQDLNEFGHSWEAIQGVWPVDTGGKTYNFENSFFVHEIDFGTIVILGEKYEQEAIIFKPDDGTVGLYSLVDNMASIAIEFDVRTNMPVLREQEEVDYMTRFRQTELSYTWSDPIPFGNYPVYPEDVSHV